jgi:Phytanoyl-CoA dioxygenase (PhyH)
MDHRIETLIDGRSFSWAVAGDFNWGSGAPLAEQNEDPLAGSFGPAGYRIVDLPEGTADLARANAARVLGFEKVEDLERYHERIDDETHHRLSKKNVDLRLKDIGLPGEVMAEEFGRALGVKLSTFVPGLGSDHVQLRIIRPGKTDYNPPHRDAALPELRSTLNIWIPIVAVDRSSSLPIVPGSHQIPESECWQTAAGSARIAGRLYNVPAIGKTRSGPLQMIRTGVRIGQALLFTPYLVHGLGANFSGERTRMAVELRLHVENDAA